MTISQNKDDAAKKALVCEALKELVESAKYGAPKTRVGLMAAGSEFGVDELISGAKIALESDTNLTVVGIGAKPDNYSELQKEKWAQRLDWIECPNCEADIATAMEKALKNGQDGQAGHGGQGDELGENGKSAIAGAVALHYPFPVGVTTIGRVLTPAKGHPMLMASCTGTSATHRPEAMLRNAIYGIATAKALGIEKPTLGILNLDSATPVRRSLTQLQEKGYAVNFGESTRKGGGSLMRGNDILAGAVDVCVTDSLTGNVLMKTFSAFNSGGSYEVSGWGYGPSVGENWKHIISIISRASGAPVIGNALLYTAALARGGLVEKVEEELKAARKAGLDAIISSLAPKTSAQSETVKAPPAEPTDEEIHGIDVLDLDNAVQELWKVGIYAESAMGCTGPVVKLASKHHDKATEILKAASFI